MKSCNSKLFLCILFLTMITVSVINAPFADSKMLYMNSDEGLNSMSNTTEVRASHILVSSKDEATKLRQEIVDGKIDFATAAKEYSKCPSGQNGGDLGFFGKGVMVPEFETAAFSLKVGEVSQPVQTQFGWHLIEVTAEK